MNKSKKRLNKDILLFLLFLGITCLPLFAEGGLETLESWTDKIIGFLSGGFVKALCLIVLAGMAISVVVQGKQGGDMRAILGKFAPWAIGVLILLSASEIINTVMGDFTLQNPAG